jgi:hypothetical protein
MTNGIANDAYVMTVRVNSLEELFAKESESSGETVDAK